jgi:hypothetical protein
MDERTAGATAERPAADRIAPAYVSFASEADSSDVTGEVLTLPGGETTAGRARGRGTA